MIKSFRAGDGEELFYRHWQAEDERKVLIIIHGASEHSGRYGEFAHWLNARGVSVYALDNRGHGLNSQGLGFVHIDSSKWHRLVEDVSELGQLVREETEKKPYLLGHSMGSFIGRSLALEGGDFETFIFTGTGYQPALKLELSFLLTKSLIKIHGEKYPSPLTERLSFEVYRRTMIKRGYTSSPYGWLTSDKTKLGEALEEEALKEPFSLGAFLVLLRLVERAQDSSRLENLQAPIYFLSGDRDVVGDFGRGVDRVVELYRKSPAPIHRISYPAMHHEILNETRREEVYQDIYYLLNR